MKAYRKLQGHLQTPNKPQSLATLFPFPISPELTGGPRVAGAGDVGWGEVGL